MNAIYSELRDRYLKARSNKEKDEVLAELTELIVKNPDEAYGELLDGIKGLNRGLTGLAVRDELQDVLKIVKGKYIAETYFGKPLSWFSQRLNGNTVGASRVFFTEDEAMKIQEAVRDIGRRLSEFKFSDDVINHS